MSRVRDTSNKLAKARKTRKSPRTLGLKKFGPGKLRVKKVWAQNIFIDFLANILENIFVFLFFVWGGLTRRPK